ncbi:MAG: outer membrane beta-barrel protein [Saprospiraceae bacterium]
MHRIHGNRTLLLTALLVLIGSAMFAQKTRGSYNFRDHSSKPYYFGITLGYNSSSYKLFHSEDFIRNDSIFSTTVDRDPGLDLKIVTNLKVGQYIDIRFLPGLAFAGRSIMYKYQDEETRSRKISSVFAEFPVQVRYKSEPWKDIRMFVLGGVKYSYDVASDARSNQADELVKFSPSDFQLEVGTGMQFFFPYFIFSPEIKFSHGLGNVLIYDDRLRQSLVLDKVLSRALTISLHFEG